MSFVIDVFSVCQCTTSAFRPISKPTLIKWFVWVAFMEENGQVKDLRTVKKFCSSHREALSLEPPYEGWDGPALRYAFQYMGVTDIQFIHANGLDMGDEARKRG